jgi:hypothetical protein
VAKKKHKKKKNQPLAEARSGGLSGLLPEGRTEQFLLGAAIGAAAAYVLSDEALRARLLRAGIRLYGEVMGGFAEIKEQMADIQAEVAAER